MIMQDYIKSEIYAKLKLLGMGNNKIDGFYVGEKFIVVRLGGGTILRLEIDGNHAEIIN